MQKEIRVIVGVNGNDHAKLIREDIVTAVKNRTVIYCVSKPFDSADTVESLFIRENPDSPLALNEKLEKRRIKKILSLPPPSDIMELGKRGKK